MVFRDLLPVRSRPRRGCLPAGLPAVTRAPADLAGYRRALWPADGEDLDTWRVANEARGTGGSGDRAGRGPSRTETRVRHPGRGRLSGATGLRRREDPP